MLPLGSGSTGHHLVMVRVGASEVLVSHCDARSLIALPDARGEPITAEPGRKGVGLSIDRGSRGLIEQETADFGVDPTTKSTRPTVRSTEPR